MAATTAITSSAPPDKAVAKTVEANRDLSLWVSPDLWLKHQEKFQPGDLVEFRREGKMFQHWGLYLGDRLVVHVSSFDLWQPLACVSERFSNASSASQNTSCAVSAVSVAQTAEEAESAAGELKETVSDVKEALMGDGELLSTQCEGVKIEASPRDLGFSLEDRTKWFIKVEDILKIAGRDQFRVNNIAARSYRRAVRTPKEIFDLVKVFKDTEVDYSLVTCNCEHFVTSLKYKKMERQEPTKDAEETKDPKDIKDPIDVIPVVIHSSIGTSSQVQRVVKLVSLASAAIVGLAGAAVATLLTRRSDPSTLAEPVSKKSKPGDQSADLLS
ncbi:hypothetical protein RvY_00759 [Ramazzottius varieornatus]|uniref:LRAT domain-containing protein n=1 Tax=Ramazzottius varieornatus TaxID=947166 RepID=A0A1D1UK34_RAMVA|nr:hypothetical protein RvY_00759 [Ramazzottius varieornatus]